MIYAQTTGCKLCISFQMKRKIRYILISADAHRFSNVYFILYSKDTVRKLLIFG